VYWIIKTPPERIQKTGYIPIGITLPLLNSHFSPFPSVRSDCNYSVHSRVTPWQTPEEMVHTYITVASATRSGAGRCWNSVPGRPKAWPVAGNEKLEKIQGKSSPRPREHFASTALVRPRPYYRHLAEPTTDSGAGFLAWHQHGWAVSCLGQTVCCLLERLREPATAEWWKRHLHLSASTAAILWRLAWSIRPTRGPKYTHRTERLEGKGLAPSQRAINVNIFWVPRLGEPILCLASCEMYSTVRYSNCTVQNELCIG
jgi:hypothetical protein